MGDQEMRPLLLYNHSGYENRGCEAIVESTVSLFQNECPVVVVASDTAEYDRQKSRRQFIRSRIPPMSLARMVNSVAFRLGQSREDEVARNYSPVIQQGKKSLCLSVGGDTYCYAYQEHMHVINKRLKEKHAPLVLWGCSIDPERMRDETLRDLEVYDLIVPRESISACAMMEKGLPVVQWIDPAFTLPAVPVQLPAGWQDGHMVGLNISPLVLDKISDPEQGMKNVLAMVDDILENTAESIALIPHVTWEHDNDLSVLDRIFKHYQGNPRVVQIPGTWSAMEYKAAVSGMKALITARTHLSIAAYSTSVPVFVIGYSVKARGIARDIYGNEEGHLFPADRLGEEGKLQTAVMSFLSHNKEEKAFLKTRMKNYISGEKEIVKRVLDAAGA